ncbi:MAG: helix-turn-helix domain-containing protein [Oscillospiraceae bacterium]
MTGEIIKSLRETAKFSQAELARRLDVSRSSVNAWEMGLSMPTAQYLVALAKIFHVSTDYLLGVEPDMRLVLDGYSQQEVELVYQLVRYFDQSHEAF